MIYDIANPRLETSRLILRGLNKNDAPNIARLAGDEQVAATTLNIPHPYVEDDANDFIDYAQRARWARDNFIFAMTIKPHDALIGCIGLTIQPMHQRGELGYWLGVPFWGQGYTTEAAQEVIRFGFEVLGLHRIYAMYFIHNTASARVLEKIGMKYEGLLRQHYFRWGKAYDTGCFGLLREEYTP